MAQTNLMIYAAKGQSSEQQSKDRYECHVWSVQQSGFDPSAPQQAEDTSPQRKGGLLPGGDRRDRRRCREGRGYSVN